MDRILIKRDKTRPSAKATFGEIYVNGVKMGVTLEPPVTHIPSGNYSAKIYQSPRFGRKVIWLNNVSGFTAIEIHVGNKAADTKGCILVGASRHGDQVWHSAATLDKIINSLTTSDNIEVIIK